MNRATIQPAQPLIFMRHGETSWNREARYQGTTDTPLSQEGVNQVLQNAALIAELIGEDHFWTIVSSPLQRASESAKIVRKNLAERVPEPVMAEPHFREIGLGRWQGLNSQQVKDQFYEERKRRKHDRWRFAPEGGESLESRKTSLEQALIKLRPHTIIVTHAGILRILTHILGGQSKQEAAKANPPHVGLMIWDKNNLKTCANTVGSRTNSA